MINSQRKSWFIILGRYLCLLLVFAFFPRVTKSSLDSNNYRIWLDTLDSGGGTLNSDNFKMDSNFNNRTQNNALTSTNFANNIIFSAIENEPCVGFSVESVTLNFGELSPTRTAYSSHTFSAFTNAKDGYTIKVYGLPLHSVDHTLTQIGSTPVLADQGVEQFGLNLAANTNPAIGSAPLSGSGQAELNYSESNKFAFNSGDVIAYSTSYSYQTTYTVTVVVNIANDTPAGIYQTVLTYEFIPVF